MGVPIVLRKLSANLSRHDRTTDITVKDHISGLIDRIVLLNIISHALRHIYPAVAAFIRQLASDRALQSIHE
jgi:hypothetical protein